MTDSVNVSLYVATNAPPAFVMEDLSALQARAYDPIGLHAWAASEIATTMASETSRLLIARQNCGALCGFLLARVVDTDGEILGIAVDPAYRRQKIGHRLMDGLLRSEKDANMQRLILEVAITNNVATTFYQILNFHEIGIRKNYYLIDRKRVDARVMERLVI